MPFYDIVEKLQLFENIMPFGSYVWSHTITAYVIVMSPTSHTLFR